MTLPTDAQAHRLGLYVDKGDAEQSLEDAVPAEQADLPPEWRDLGPAKLWAVGFTSGHSWQELSAKLKQDLAGTDLTPIRIDALAQDSRRMKWADASALFMDNRHHIYVSLVFHKDPGDHKWPKTEVNCLRVVKVEPKPDSTGKS